MELAYSNMRVRVDSCLAVLRDVSHRLALEEHHQAIVDQLRHLDTLLSLIDHRVIKDHELARIEGITNQLLDEIGVLFNHKHMGSLYDCRLH